MFAIVLSSTRSPATVTLLMDDPTLVPEARTGDADNADVDSEQIDPRETSRAHSVPMPALPELVEMSAWDDARLALLVGSLQDYLEVDEIFAGDQNASADDQAAGWFVSAAYAAPSVACFYGGADGILNAAGACVPKAASSCAKGTVACREILYGPNLCAPLVEDRPNFSCSQAFVKKCAGADGVLSDDDGFSCLAEQAGRVGGDARKLQELRDLYDRVRVSCDATSATDAGVRGRRENCDDLASSVESLRDGLDDVSQVLAAAPRLKRTRSRAQRTGGRNIGRARTRPEPRTETGCKQRRLHTHREIFHAARARAPRVGRRAEVGDGGPRVAVGARSTTSRGPPFA